MSFWDGFIGGLNERRLGELDRQRKNEDSARELESKIALRLLDDDDPDLQEQGLSILQQSITPSKKKKGFGGFMGNLEDRTGLRSMLDFARGLAKPGQLQELPPEEGSAALPDSSPTQPKTGQPSMLQQAVQGGVKFGAPTPGDTSGLDPTGAARTPPFVPPGTFPATASEVPGQASFGGIQFGEPGMGNPNAQVPAINVAKIAGRVSQDKGQPQPGERARLFFPSKARLESQSARARTKGEFEVYAEQLQALGATPAETRRAMMAKMGASGGQPNISPAGYVKLADGRTVRSYTYEEAGVPPQIVIAGPTGGMMPLPADAVETRMGPIGGGSQTSKMTGRQALEFGLVTEEDNLDPNQYYSVKQMGDTIQIMPTTRPSEPLGFQRGSGFAPTLDRNGNPLPNSADLQQQANARVAAAKGLLRGLPTGTMAGTGAMRSRELARRQSQIPALRGLTEAQVRALAEADDYLPDAQVDRILQQVNPPPSSMAAPPGSDPNVLPPDWADRLAKELLNQQGRTMTPPPRPQ